MGKLSHLISQKVDCGLWKPIKVGRSGPNVSHLMFADDLLLFGEATTNQMSCMKDTLDKFCSMFGQMVSVEKTSILFVKCVNYQTRQRLVNQSSFREMNSLGKYHGVPLIGRTPRRADFAYVVDMVKKKLARWKANQLSFVDRVTLSKAVIEPPFIP